MKIDYEQSTKVWDVKINTKSYLKVRPTVANEVEVVLTGVPLFRVALLSKELRITTILKYLPEITTAVTLKSFYCSKTLLALKLWLERFLTKLSLAGISTC